MFSFRSFLITNFLLGRPNSKLFCWRKVTGRAIFLWYLEQITPRFLFLFPFLTQRKGKYLTFHSANNHAISYKSLHNTNRRGEGLVLTYSSNNESIRHGWGLLSFFVCCLPLPTTPPFSPPPIRLYVYTYNTCIIIGPIPIL